jgi:hypothetical protein
VKQRLEWPGLPRPTACASRFSQPLDAFIRPTPAGLVSCQIRSWGLPFRALLLPRSRTPSPAPMPSCRWKRPTTLPGSQPPSRAPKCRARNRPPWWEGPRSAPRLQGFAPRESPPHPAGGLGRQQRVALLGFHLSRVFPLGGMATAFTAPPLMRLRLRATNRPRAPSTGFHFHTRLAGLSRDCRPS